MNDYISSNLTNEELDISIIKKCRTFPPENLIMKEKQKENKQILNSNEHFIHYEEKLRKPLKLHSNNYLLNMKNFVQNYDDLIKDLSERLDQPQKKHSGNLINPKKYSISENEEKKFDEMSTNQELINCQNTKLSNVKIKNSPLKKIKQTEQKEELDFLKQLKQLDEDDKNMQKTNLSK